MRVSKSVAILFKTLVFCMPFYSGSSEAQNTIPWIVYYSNKEPPEAFLSYQVIVFDSDAHPALFPLRAKERIILGYLSVGEVSNNRKYFSSLEEEKILLKENDNWKGSFMVDLRDLRWTKRLLEDLIPSILQQGFDGLFLDTLDNAPYLEQISPEKYKGMKQAAIDLLKTIRKEFPSIKLMANRGYDILDEIAPYIDIVLGESVYSTYHNPSKTYKLVSEADHFFQVQALKRAKQHNSKLELFSLDYWDPSDKAGIAKIYAKERNNGFHPYVSTILLNEIVKE